MTDDEIRIAIAESVGLLKRPDGGVVEYQEFRGDSVFQGVRLPSGHTIPVYISLIPYYTEDLNAMHEVERTLTGNQCLKYVEKLNRATKCFEHITPAIMVFSTARQRAEAYLRTIGKWKE